MNNTPIKFGLFKINDLDIKSFLKIILAIQLAMLGVISLDATSLQIPIIRPVIGFIYLTFVPGIILLRILKLHKLGNIETVLYTVGLSIATLMFTGLFMNTIYPLFGISGPISITPLIITISVIVLVLCVLCYARDKDFSDPSYIDIKSALSSPALLLCFIPFLSIFGTYLVNFHHPNIILMFLIIIIALIVVLIAFDMFIPKNLYPLAVFITAISLLYHSSLISMYIWGGDIQTEYYFINLVTTSAHWDTTIPSSSNAMLSIVLLAPIFSDICDMSITWVFKIIYPLLFSLVPLGLYFVFQKQTNDKIAFLSCFFFVSMSAFYFIMPQLARQEIAELFLVLLILLMIDKDMDKIKRSFLFIIFGISLAVSHYGLSYIFMASLISAWLLLVLIDYPAIQRLTRDFHSKFSRYKTEILAGNPISSNAEDRTISTTFVLLFIVFTLAWYMYVSSSFAFNVIIHLGNHIVSSIFTDFLNPEVAQGLGIIKQGATSSTSNITLILHLMTQFFIAIGILILILKPGEMKFEREYAAFALVNFAICIAAIAVPYFGSALDTIRLYHITLVFLAPFCVIGGITVFKIVSKLVKASWTNKRVRSSLKVLSLFFAIFLLFNSGFVHEIVKDPYPISISLNNTTDYPRFNEQEVLGAEWLYRIKCSNSYIYADIHRWVLLNRFEWGHVAPFSINIGRLPENSYIYFGDLNVREGKVAVFFRDKVLIRKYIEAGDIVNGRDKIYANGGSEVYR